MYGYMGAALSSLHFSCYNSISFTIKGTTAMSKYHCEYCIYFNIWL